MTVGGIVLTRLYVPADRPDRARKAFASSADVVILDLEDAVTTSAKHGARRSIPDLLAASEGRPLEVRVNALSTVWGVPDLEAIAPLPAEVGVQLPMVSSPTEVESAQRIVGDRPVHVLVETAAGIEALGEIAAVPGVASIGLGEVDLSADLGVTSDDGLAWCRQRVIVAARAAGLPPPNAAVYPNIDDVEGLAESTSRARDWGFVGRAAIHPRQLPVIEMAFAPMSGEIQRARQVLDTVAAASARGHGTSTLPDGSFLDIAMIRQARRVLALHERAQRPGSAGVADSSRPPRL
ncbi:HpcH/HpaI aldolase/citrate lyase family protein [Jiangella asiatica]|uniref:CoA ester lyase n=1 Tax=Jiangella asiatica TaxID=2530372 RepID=A0A4R5DFE4_9ACTN|nr:CoA ester lyase [Jiangella asiatica]TDE10611.1 CoA ester lyase [Jiangella asiatica]